MPHPEPTLALAGLLEELLPSSSSQSRVLTPSHPIPPRAGHPRVRRWRASSRWGRPAAAARRRRWSRRAPRSPCASPPSSLPRIHVSPSKHCCCRAACHPPAAHRTARGAHTHCSSKHSPWVWVFCLLLISINHFNDTSHKKVTIKPPRPPKSTNRGGD